MVFLALVVFFFALLPLPWEKEGTETFNVNKSKTTNVLHGVGLSSSPLSSSHMSHHHMSHHICHIIITNVLHGVGLSSSSLSSSSLFFFSLFVFGVFTVPGVGV